MFVAFFGLVVMSRKLWLDGLDEQCVGRRLHAVAQERERHLLAQLQAKTAEAAKWEARASRFIDQIGLADGKLAAPVMAADTRPPSESPRSILAALGQSSIPRTATETVPTTAPTILGVNADAARDAIAGVLNNATR